MNSSDERRKSKMRTVPSSEHVASLASVGEKLKRGKSKRRRDRETKGLSLRCVFKKAGEE